MNYAVKRENGKVLPFPEKRRDHGQICPIRLLPEQVLFLLREGCIEGLTAKDIPSPFYHLELEDIGDLKKEIKKLKLYKLKEKRALSFYESELINSKIEKLEFVIAHSSAVFFQKISSQLQTINLYHFPFHSCCDLGRTVKKEGDPIRSYQMASSKNSSFGLGSQLVMYHPENPLLGEKIILVDTVVGVYGKAQEKLDGYRPVMLSCELGQAILSQYDPTKEINPIHYSVRGVPYCCFVNALEPEKAKQRIFASRRV